jgi:hypothetical protein
VPSVPASRARVTAIALSWPAGGAVPPAPVGVQAVAAAPKVRFTGLAQTLGQLSDSNRDF